MKKLVVCFGEVLWDVLPAGKLAGGAPMNVAIRLKSLGIDAAVISKIGNDNNGEELFALIKAAGVNTSLLQKGDIATGTVQVTLDGNGNASYEIVYPSAWDKIELTNEQIAVIANADAFVFGSLVRRDEMSRLTLNTLIEKAKWNVFDVNLRAPHYSLEDILALMKKSNLIKLNDDELTIITNEIINRNDGINNNESKTSSEDLEKQIKIVANYSGVKHICVTRGANGAVLYFDDVFYFHGGYQVKVQDTIGAGDSFLATLLVEILNKASAETALDKACAMGALVASKPGANAIVTEKELESILKTKAPL